MFGSFRGWPQDLHYITHILVLLRCEAILTHGVRDFPSNFRGFDLGLESVEGHLVVENIFHHDEGTIPSRRRGDHVVHVGSAISRELSPDIFHYSCRSLEILSIVNSFLHLVKTSWTTIWLRRGFLRTKSSSQAASSSDDH